MDSKVNNNLVSRPPIVVVVGHVDHGKTSLLDYIRKTNVVSKEVGGITQSTGGYEIEHPSTGSGQAKKITFIDTPGHEAFSKMRERGAEVADIAILVVAGDEGFKPQTTEALSILRSSETPFLVAITKADKPGFNLEKIKSDLITNGVYLEGNGGDISWQAVSSKNGEGVNELLDLILLMGEVLDLQYDPKASATGFVLESLKDMKRGVVAYLILKNGILKEGDEIATPSARGKIKTLENFLGERTKNLVPSAPASMLGFESIPLVGEEFFTGDRAGETWKMEEKEKVEKVPEDAGKVKAILKSDTSGSLEVLSQVLAHLVTLKGMSVGDVTDGDVKSAVSSGSIIVSFGVKTNKAAEGLAKAQSVQIFSNDIIYKLVEEIDKYKKEKDGPVYVGELDILRVFGNKDKKQIIGGVVKVGEIRVGSDVRIIRNESVLGEGKIVNVQAGKKDVPSIPEGTEGGLLLDSETRVRAGDRIKAL
ncbi:MAG: translation initiation factor IF-2 [Patescibacteria group bacterium]